MNTLPQTALDGLARIVAIGFVRVGCWRRSDGRLGFELNGLAPARNVLYAFVVDGELMYIGKTVLSLRKRMGAYKHPAASQLTNVKNNRYINQVLSGGTSHSLKSRQQARPVTLKRFQLSLSFLVLRA